MTAQKVWRESSCHAYILGFEDSKLHVIAFLIVVSHWSISGPKYKKPYFDLIIFNLNILKKMKKMMKYEKKTQTLD